MQITRDQALFLYKVLYHYTTIGDRLAYNVIRQTENFLHSLEDFLSEDSENEKDDGDDGEETEEDLEQDDIQTDETLPVSTLVSLPKIFVKSPAGDEISLEFDESPNDENCVDALLDESSVIVDSISCITIKGKLLELHDGDQWHSYEVKKLPKTWSRVLQDSVVYGLEAGDEDEG